MREQTLKGVASLCAGALVFSLQDVLLKYVAGSYPLSQVLVLRTIVALPILFVLVWRAGELSSLWRGAGFLTTRGALLFVSYAVYYMAFPALPLADATALYFTVPLFVIILSGPYLGEHASWPAWAAVGIGLAGVLIALQPGTGVFEWAALLSLISGATYAFSALMARKAGATASGPMQSLYQNAVFFLAAAAMALLFQFADVPIPEHPSLKFVMRPWRWPAPFDAALMLSCGVIAAAGTVLLVNGYRYAQANIAASFEYTLLLWLILWGWLIFGEIPKLTTAIGAALIVAAGLIALLAQTRGRSSGAAGEGGE